MSEVTVVIPYRRGDRKDWLEQALASLPDVPRRVYENENDLAGAMNRGLREAETEFCFFLGADDVLGENALEYLLQFAARSDVVYPSLVVCDENLTPGEHLSADPFCAHRLERWNFVAGCSLVRREKALAVGGFRDLEVLEDWDLWLRMQKAGARFTACPKAEVFYRQHDQSRNARARVDADYLARLSKELSPSPTPVSATFYAQATPATAYLRCQVPSRYLPGMTCPAIEIAYDGSQVKLPAQVGDTAVLQFPADKLRAAYALLLRNEGVRVLVEADDNYLINPGKAILRRSQWTMQKGEPGYVGQSRRGHQWITGKADGAIVTGRRLADAYSKLVPEVFICPNSVDPADWPEPEKPDDGILRIAWIASVSHKPDIPLVTKAFEWASRQPGVEVYVSEELNPGWTFPHGKIPWLEDLAQYRELFSYFDIGLAPIRQLPFAQYRSDIKATEYAMGLCAPVLQECDSYEEWTDGENCLKAADARGFEKALRHLVAHREDVKGLAQAAREFALSERSIHTTITSWREAIAG